MAEQGVTRRLAAILAADVAGFSRLMGVDEAGTLARLKAQRRELLDPAVTHHNGRLVKTSGDGLLIEFASVVDAVECALRIQRGMASRNAGVPADERLDYRIGINLGDVIVDGDDIYGDGVNIAARLEGLAEAGGICISLQVMDQIQAKLDIICRDMGEQAIKNIVRPVRVFNVMLNGPGAGLGRDGEDRADIEQEIRFCTTDGGVRLAYSTVGQGPPLVKAANWLTHLEYDWRSPVWRHLMEELARDHTLVRYDTRGSGLSDWEVEDISFAAFVRDLETVVDAAGLERFALLGISQGCAASIAYAVRHPERVTHLVLYGGYAQGRHMRGSQEQIDQREAMLTLLRQGWGQENPAFRQLFTSLFMPDATAEQAEWFNELQKNSASPENAERIARATDIIEVEQLLPEVTAPTLVLHCRDEAVCPFEEGRRMAAGIPNARFVGLEGRNHLMMENEPAWARFLDEVRRFLGDG